MKLIFQKKIAHQDVTKACAQDIYEQFLKNEDNFALFLEGGLGVGKTFFVRELLSLWGIKEPVSSPTYVYLQEYETDRGIFAHFDFYRLADGDEFFARGFQDTAEDPNISCFVEWPDKLPPEGKASFSGTRYVLQIAHGVGASMRDIKLLKA